MTQTTQVYKETTFDDAHRYAAGNSSYERRSAVAWLQSLLLLTSGLIVLLLGMRLLLALLGANPANTFASAVYTFSDIFVSPFRNLFGYNSVLGFGSRFEVETLVAAAAYLLMAWVVVRLLDVLRSDVAI